MPAIGESTKGVIKSPPPLSLSHTP